MNLKVGIIGLANVGKSTLFNSLTQQTVEMANYPFATIEPHMGIVKLQDSRLRDLSQIVETKKVVPAIFEFIDIAGLIKGASQGEGLGNKFLSNIRSVHTLVHVVRCFDDHDVTHVANKVNPIEDIETVNLELLLADLQTVEKAIKRLKPKVSGGEKAVLSECQVVQKIYEGFRNEIPARDLKLTTAEKLIIKSYNLLTLKPVIYVANIGDDFISNPSESSLYQQVVDHFSKSKKTEIIPISIKFEEELSHLNFEERKEFLASYNLTHSVLDYLIKSAFKLLGLATFFTVGPMEIKAWIFNQGQTASECAGIIHSDFEKGFIRAEIIKFVDYLNYRTEENLKAKGKIKVEGKNYLIQDGDICHFKFHL